MPILPENDPREAILRDVGREIMVRANYNPHFSGLEAWLLMETKLFLARFDALTALWSADRKPSRLNELDRLNFINDPPSNSGPIPMILFCPKCSVQHIDAPEPHKPDCDYVSVPDLPCDCGRWTNPPHRSHLCAGCGFVWRPADVATEGVREIKTRGSKDTRHQQVGRVK